MRNPWLDCIDERKRQDSYPWVVTVACSASGLVESVAYYDATTIEDPQYVIYRAVDLASLQGEHLA